MPAAGAILPRTLPRPPPPGGAWPFLPSEIPPAPLPGPFASWLRSTCSPSASCSCLLSSILLLATAAGAGPAGAGTVAGDAAWLSGAASPKSLSVGPTAVPNVSAEASARPSAWARDSVFANGASPRGIASRSISSVGRAASASCLGAAVAVGIAGRGSRIGRLGCSRVTMSARTAAAVLPAATSIGTADSGPLESCANRPRPAGDPDPTGTVPPPRGALAFASRVASAAVTAVRIDGDPTGSRDGSGAGWRSAAPMARTSATLARCALASVAPSRRSISAASSVESSPRAWAVSLAAAFSSGVTSTPSRPSPRRARRRSSGVWA